MKSIAITTGEPAGIGPDLIVQLAQQSNLAQQFKKVPWCILGDGELLLARAHQLNLPLRLTPYTQNLTEQAPGELWIEHHPLLTTSVPGRLDAKNSAYVLDILRHATTGCLTKKFSALVTPPVHKGIINEAGFTFTGHTEFLAELTQTPRVVMMLATPTLRVALATTHLPLRQVPDAITSTLLTEIIHILNADLKKRFRIPSPNILVCGLNPHAGEQGHLGREEMDVIIPCLESLRAQGIHLIGPVPADTAFTAESATGCDAVLAMYHDQGLPVLKQQGFGEAVNITLGLPIIRTSVDHGTALTLAGTGKAHTSSLLAAIRMAENLIQ